MLTKKHISHLPEKIKDLVELLTMVEEDKFVAFWDLEPGVVIGRLERLMIMVGAEIAYETPYPKTAPDARRCEIKMKGKVIGATGDCSSEQVALEQALLNMCHHGDENTWLVERLDVKTKLWNEISKK